jgi:hypothetical protein
MAGVALHGGGEPLTDMFFCMTCYNKEAENGAEKSAAAARRFFLWGIKQTN